ncbi:hypothetical protein E3A20_11790 [Planctomyces bekefii]|uniref:t-SNARE coiled-coil homology domain-containing protein n=1 Tax=Planctomyces bekefii TaxID=1653850 RepID=A0A5C6M9S7_9PLAN|nr:hypothetical protein E3A20_11790 [Planctomyces bekefii]
MKRESVAKTLGSMQLQLKDIVCRLDSHDQRFVAIDARFEAIDKRFIEVDRRFDRLEARFDHLTEEFHLFRIKQEHQDSKLNQVLDVVISMNDRLSKNEILGGKIENHEHRIAALELRAQGHR